MNFMRMRFPSTLTWHTALLRKLYVQISNNCLSTWLPKWILVHSSNYCVSFLSLIPFFLFATHFICVISSANTESTVICLPMTHRYTSLLQTHLLMSKLKTQTAFPAYYVYVANSSNSSWIKWKACLFLTSNPSLSFSSKHKSRF